MDSEIIGDLILATATIIAAAIGGLVAIIVKIIELKAKEERTGKSSTKEEKRTAYWLWGVSGAIIGGLILIVGGVFFPNIFPLDVRQYNPVGVPSIQVVNPLRLSAKISVENKDRGLIEANSSKTFLVDSYPVKASFEVVKMTKSNKVSIGDDMSGSWDIVNNGQTVYINPSIDGQAYFFPIITNNSKFDCSVSINDGLRSENRPGAVVKSGKTVALGYYKLFSNSNVTLYCDNGVTYWWGIRNNKKGSPTPLDDLAQKEDGVVFLVFGGK